MKNFKVGAAKVNITAYEKGKGMMGYGMWFNTIDGVADDLYARAFVIKNNGDKVALVVAEICFYTLAVKDAVVKKLQKNFPHLKYNDANVHLAAQHTHSGPGGFSHHLFYNLLVPGFRKKIFQRVVDGTVAAIVRADNSAQDGKVQFNSGEFAPDIDVAFNRSLKAHNKNEEVKRKTQSEAHLAIDRMMRLIRFDRLNGQPLGQLNWFGVHTTSLSNDNKLISGDNKGYAAAYFEQTMREKSHYPFVAGFAQEKAGDVTPNFVWDKRKKWTRGKYEDDFASAKYNGRLQYEKALDIYLSDKFEELSVSIDSEVMYVDFSDVEADTEFTGGKTGCKTAPAAVGASMLAGTKEGPGAPAAAALFLKMASKAVDIYEHTFFRKFSTKEKIEAVNQKYISQGNKSIAIELGLGRIMGTSDIQNLIAPDILDKGIEYFKKVDKLGVTKRTPWVPHILPIQLIIIGELAILGLAAEITTVAGERLKKTVLKILKIRGVEEVIIASYANGYSGYITTAEEYDVQLYEGGHTIFGKWTLAAYQTKCKFLAQQMLRPKEKRTIDRGVQPDIFSDDEIWHGFDEENADDIGLSAREQEDRKVKAQV